MFGCYSAVTDIQHVCTLFTGLIYSIFKNFNLQHNLKYLESFFSPVLLMEFAKSSEVSVDQAPFVSLQREPKKMPEFAVKSVRYMCFKRGT